MKFFVNFVLLSLMAAPGFSKVTGSKYDPRHLRVIEEAVHHKCGLTGQLVQTKSVTEAVRVDSGIIDYNYQTEFLINQEERTQSSAVVFKVTVLSSYADQYNHRDQDWGFYSVEAVTCEIQ